MSAGCRFQELIGCAVATIVIAASLQSVPAQEVTPEGAPAAATPGTATAASTAAETVGASRPEDFGAIGQVLGGGTGRYVPDRWGMVKGVVTNNSDHASAVQLVVTAPSAEGVQFARRVTLPAKSAFETDWPVWVPSREAGNLDFNFLAFEGGEDNGVIRRRANEQVLSNFTAIVGENRTGFTAWLSAGQVTTHQMDSVMHLLRAMRFTAHNNQAVVTVVPREISGQPQSLDTLDQLAVSSNDLQNYPEVCEAIRLWMQRGGRLLLCLDMAGAEAAELLLGEALPLSVVGETSTNTVRLQINPDYRKDSYPDREVVREFDEPIRYLRVRSDEGEPIWMVDGWPVCIRVPYGKGFALVTTISPEVFYRPRNRRSDREPGSEVIGSMRRFHDTLFGRIDTQLLKSDQVTSQAAAQIGYSIPSRSFAALLTLSFPIVLLFVGLWLLKQQRGERIVWVLPVLALVIAVPALGMGFAARSVAPQTAIQTQILFAVPGQRQLASDGFATVYTPDPVALQIRGTESAIISPNDDVANNDFRRLLWTGFRENEWLNFNQPAGVNSLKLQTIRRMSVPLECRATFDEAGLNGRLILSDLTEPRDAIVVGRVPHKMAARIAADGSFTSGTSDLLTAGEYFTNSLVSDEQRQHAMIYSTVLDNKGRVDSFPDQLSVMYWARAAASAMKIGDERTRQQESLLVIQPIRLDAPPVDKLVTIPPTFLSYRAIADEKGSFSSVYNNSERTWDSVGRETAGSIRMEVYIPPVCLPFSTEQADVTLQLRAGSRTVKVLAGYGESLEQVAQLKSPVGRVSFKIPAEQLKTATSHGRFWLHIDVSDFAAGVDKSEESSGEQDDTWAIDRLLIELKGKRIAATP